MNTIHFSNQRVFVVLKDNKNVAETNSLQELVEKLEDVGIDPREVKIFSFSSYRKKRRIGLRGTKI